jgi:hypothetical protein
MKVCTIEGCDYRRYSQGWCATHWQRWKRNGDPLRLQHRATPRERFEARIDRDESTGCWVWKGTLNRTGYGLLSVDAKYVLVHRWGYEQFVKPIPDGMTLDHLCRNRACVNPAHLDVVTNRTNVLRGMSPSAVIHRQGVCKHGHEMTSDNVYVPPKNPRHRQCRTCRKRISREAYARKVGAA